MKKRLIALAGGAAVLAAAAVPVSSAFAARTPRSVCEFLAQQAYSLEEQLYSPFLTPQQVELLEARLSQILAAEQAAHCTILITG